MFIVEQPWDLLKLVVRLSRVRGGKKTVQAVAARHPFSSDSDQQLRKLQRMNCSVFLWF